MNICQRNIVFLLFLISLSLFSQQGFGQVSSENSSDSSKVLVHSPSKAAIMSAILPGLGQAYNRKYWKIPIAYIGYTAAGYALIMNQKNYKDSKNNYLALTDTLESTVSQSTRSAGELQADIDGYRRFRDLSFLALLAWHGLTIIDANVDAHFFNWDVSEDLSLRIRPRALWVGQRNPGIGLSFIFNNK